MREASSYEKAKAALTDEQRERIRAKCGWEHMSWRGVFEQWPELFGVAAGEGDATPPEGDTTNG